MDNTLSKILALLWESKTSDIDFCQRLGINKSAVTDWKKGKTKSYNKHLDDIALFFGKPLSYFAEPSDPFTPVTGSVPVLGVIRAGQPLLADEHIIGYEFTDVKNPEEYFYLLVEGDSMVNSGIRPGSKVLIHKQPFAENNQIVVCRINGGDATIKRFRQQGNTVVLLPENPAYEPLIVPCSDFESGDAEIIGVAKKVMSDL